MHRPLIGLVCLKQNNIADNETDFTANAGCVHHLLYLSQRDVYFFIYPDSEPSHLEAQKPTGHMVQGQKLEWLVMTTRFILFLSGCLETAENIGLSWEVYGITVQTKDLKVKYLMLFYPSPCLLSLTSFNMWLVSKIVQIFCTHITDFWASWGEFLSSLDNFMGHCLNKVHHTPARYRAESLLLQFSET